MNRLLMGVVGVAMSLLIFAGCLPESDVVSPEEWLTMQLANVDKDRLAKDVKQIDDSLTKWNLNSTVLTEPNGVRYIIKESGSGAKPVLNDVVEVKFKGSLLNTKAVFAPTDTLKIELYNLIMGWQTTMPLIPAGSKVTMYIPSGLGYGATDIKDSGNTKVVIPKNSNLIFEVELLKIN